MDKRYVIETPEQLKELAFFCTKGSYAKVHNVAKVWSANRRQYGGTVWDGKIFVGTEKGERCVYRLGVNHEAVVFGWLEEKALEWCEKNLREG